MDANHDLVIERVANAGLADYLDRHGPAAVFARYVAARAPGGRSLTCTQAGRIAGAVIGGAEHGLDQAFAHWLLADSEDVAIALARSLVVRSHASTSGERLYLEVRPEHADLVASALDRSTTALRRSIDSIYVVHEPVADAGTVRVERLDAARLRALSWAPELGPVLGVLDDWSHESRLHGVIDRDVLVAVAEASVSDGRYAAIQQVFTASTHRGRGLARAIVAFVTNDLLARALVPVYVVDQENTASECLVEGLGFELHEQWAFFEADSHV